MQTDGWPAGWRLRELAEVDSTMAEAQRIAPGLAAPEWILAHHQTAARGRRGRAWHMPRGNFAATLVLPDAGPPAQAALRSFSAALALHDSLTLVTGRGDGLTLKWPNDVLLHGGKVAGILLEGLPTGALAIGVGINLAAAPESAEVEPGAVRPVSLVGETGVLVPPAEMMTHLAAAFAGWEDRFRSYGFEPIRNAWLSRAARLGQEITARTGSETLQGTFETIDSAGQLVLATSAGRRHIAAAEVFF